MRFLALCLLVAALALPGPTHAQTRHALVIGIGHYAHVKRLQLARNDADDVGTALAVLGVQVTTMRDPDRRP